jgi:RimJ/RimL family protein N-acetyltransferase
MQIKWFESYKEKEDDFIFIIETLNEIPVGMISLYNIDYDSKNADFGRLVIGNKSYRGKTYSWDTSQSLISFAFTDLGLCQLNLKVLKDNYRAFRFYEKIGFHKIESSKKSKHFDSIIMTLDKEAFF